MMAFDLPNRDDTSGEATLQSRAALIWSMAIVSAVASLAVVTPTRVLAEGGPVRIGYLTDVGGPSSSNDGTAGVDAARMAIEDFGGTVLGRRIELLVGDHQGKVDIGASITRRWLEGDGVEAVMGIDNSAIPTAANYLFLATY